MARETLGPTAADEHQAGFFAVDRRGDEFLRGAVDRPKRLAGVRIETGDAAIAALNELGAAGQLADERGAVADPWCVRLTRQAFAVGRFRATRKESPLLSPSTMTLSWYSTGSLLKPHSPAWVPGRASQSCSRGRVVGGDDNIVAHAEGDKDPLAIGGRRAGGIAVFLVDLLQRSLHHGLLPEHFAAGAVQAKQHALLRLGQAVTVKTRSPQTIGEAWPTPGSSVFHAAFATAHCVGTSFSRQVPSARGPRQQGQFRRRRGTCNSG